jgi:hypothetical protein
VNEKPFFISKPNRFGSGCPVYYKTRNRTKSNIFLNILISFFFTVWFLQLIFFQFSRLNWFFGFLLTPSNDPLEVPIGPIPRARAKKLKEALNRFVQNIWSKMDLEGLSVFVCGLCDHGVRIIWHQSLTQLIRLYASEIFISCCFRKNSLVSNFFFSLNLQHIKKIVISFCYCPKYISSIKKQKKRVKRKEKKNK